MATPLAPIQELFPSLPPLLPFPKAEGQEERLRFLIQTDVPSDGKASSLISRDFFVIANSWAFLVPSSSY